MKKHLLNEDFDLNSKVYGLVSTKPFLELAWCLKNDLDLPFVRVDDVHWLMSRQPFYSPIYEYVNLMTETTFSLVRNKADSGWLANEYKTIDAFLVETNFSSMFTLKLSEISKSKWIQYCFEVDVQTLRKPSQHRLDIN